MVQAAEKTGADYVLVESDRYFDSINRFERVSSGFLDGWFPPYPAFNWREISGNIFESQRGWSWDKLLRRDLVDRNHLRFQLLSSSEDLSFGYTALAYSEIMSVIDNPLVHHRRETENSVSKIGLSHPENGYLALMDLKEHLALAGLFDELEQQFLDYAINFLIWALKHSTIEVRDLAINQLKREWNRNLGIEQTPAEHFVEEAQYWEYMELLK
jgi:hypothetical protein